MYIKTSRDHSDNYIRFLNYINGGSFFESVEEPIAGNFDIFTEADDDPDPDVSKAEDDEDPEVNTDNDDENPEVTTNDEPDNTDNGDTDTGDNTDDTNNDTTNDREDDNTDDTTDDEDTGDNNGEDDTTTEDDGGGDDTDDMSSDPHDVGGDDEDPDAGSDDEDTGDDGGTEEEKEKDDDKPGTDFENMRRYNLYKKFMSLNDSITSYTDTLDAIVYDDDDLNAVTKTVSTKLKQLGDILYDYMTMKFENDSYTQALLFYHQVNAGIRMSFDLLTSKSNNQKKR